MSSSRDSALYIPNSTLRVDVGNQPAMKDNRKKKRQKRKKIIKSKGEDERQRKTG
jgi:hypothetical protein